MDDRGGLSLLQRPASNLVLTREPDAVVALRVGEEPVERANPVGMAAQAIVHADHHHPPPRSSLFVELVELVAQRLFVRMRIIALEREVHVVHVERIRHHRKIAAAHRNDEGFVTARIVDAVEKAEILERLVPTFDGSD
jgi:hypothetical protein